MSATPEFDLPSTDVQVLCVRTADELEAYTGAWHRLVETAVEPNVFYEPHLLLPAWRRLASNRVCCLLFLAEKRQNSDGSHVLCGLFPLEKRSWPAAYSLWKHSYSFSGHPLVRRDCQAEVWRAFLDWMHSAGAAVWRLPYCRADGPLHRTFWDEVQQRGVPYWVQRMYRRALFEPAESADAFRNRAMTRKTRKDTQRLRNRLAEQGEIRSEAMDATGDPLTWANQFLDLEHAGWKGRNGTSMLSHPDHADFFRDAVCGAHALGRMVMLQLWLDDRLLAASSCFAGGSGAFYFKIAFDEDYERFSPGILLEMAFIDWLHGPHRPAWVDSCAEPNHPSIDRLWDGRRADAHGVVGRPTLVGTFCAWLHDAGSAGEGLENVYEERHHEQYFDHRPATVRGGIQPHPVCGATQSDGPSTVSVGPAD